MSKYLFPAKVTVLITGLYSDAHTCWFLGFFFWIHATLTLLLNMGYIKVMWAIKNYCYSEAFLSM